MLVITAAIITTIVKLVIAGSTHGTNDVRHWQAFAALVHRDGPINIYATHLAPPYNHPPLIGWMLVAINAVVAHVGLSVRFLVRVPASCADVVTAYLVFEFVRRSRSVRAATAAGLIFALSPVMFIISGFHGNTDPVFVMLILLSAYLLAVKDRPALAGASAALACSVKLVPIVALPALVAAIAYDRRKLVRAAIGYLVVFIPLWLPAVARQWPGLKRNVIEYTGWDGKNPHWGIVDAAHHADLPHLVNYLAGSGRFLILLTSAAVPAVLVWRRRESLAAGVGLSLALFLLLTPTFATQYLAWAAAGVLLLDVVAGAAYNIAAGALLFLIYNRWSNGLPWDRANATPLIPREALVGWVVWMVLLTCVVLGIVRMWRWPAGRDTEPPRQPALESEAQLKGAH